MNDYEKTIAVLQDRVRALEERLMPCDGVVAKPKKWSPVGGEYYVSGYGIVFCYTPKNKEMSEFGVERPTQQQAERASIEMRRFNRLLALRDELCGDEVRHIYEIMFDTKDERWVATTIRYYKGVTVGFEKESHAKRACDMLNSGEVEL